MNLSRPSTEPALDPRTPPADGRRSAPRMVRVLARCYGAGFAQLSSGPSALVGFALFFVMPPIALGTVWKVAAESSGGAVAGYSATALVWYIAASETAILTVRNRLIEEIGEDITSGRTMVELQRPVSALWVRLAYELGFMSPRFLVGLALAGVIGFVLGGAPPSLAALALAVPSLVLALAINAAAQHMFAAATYWLREAKGAWFLYNKLVFVLGGMLLPLEVLPDGMELVAKALPFMAMAYVPSRLAAGFIEPELILVQLLWLAIALGGAAWAFHRGQLRAMSGR